MNCSASDVLIIGYGNPLRGDDGVGWHAAQRIDEHRSAGHPRLDGWRTMTVHQLLPEHAQTISEAGRVIFIDASVDDAPGVWQRRPLTASSPGDAIDSHALGAQEILALADRLYGRCPPADLYTIGGADFSLGERLSPQVQRAMEAVVAAILDAA